MTGLDTAEELRRRLADRTAVWEFLRLFTAAWGLPGEPVAAPDEVADPLITETAWGIPLDAADRPDPPVVVDTGSGWRPYLDRLSLACVDFALTAAIEGAREPDLDQIYAALPGACWSR
ncbi:hypothetical protein [Catellatospora sp. NPDC049133]|uniref:hypothetical protein n=1 Tax=Catellatospora sp. NPDC049133 TaxID=3155499 RepID=UPI0033E0F11C